MKITKLHIEQYRHLENLTFDFTYQSGEKKGQPLEKICFIGQSATGKTNLLEILFECINYSLKAETINDNLSKQSIPTVNFAIQFGNNLFRKNENVVTYQNKSYSCQNVVDSLVENEFKKNLLYFKSNLISDNNIDFFTKNPIELFEKHIDKLDNPLFRASVFMNQIATFDDKIDETIWVRLLSDILDYRRKLNQKMSELFHKGLLKNPSKLQDEFNLWQKSNPNILEHFSKKFNPLLSKLNLKIDLIDTTYTIPICNKHTDEVFPIQNTSTGTKGLLLSFVPLFKLAQSGSIIIIDEPERSLYPDMQIDLMDYYKSFAPDSQIIVATHSPFIAAAFEPDERFILYFNEKGKVEVRRGSSPIGDDPNDILKNDFGINYYNKYGEEAYRRYLKLKEDLANEENPAKKKELLLETVKLGDTYNF